MQFERETLPTVIEVKSAEYEPTWDELKQMILTR